MSKHNHHEPDHKSLADVMKNDSNVISLAFEDGTPNRDNWSEFFDTLGRFLTTFNIKVVGIDKTSYSKLVSERIDRQRKAQELAKGIVSPDQAPPTPEIILASPSSTKEV